jgi:hypothetical protein
VLACGESGRAVAEAVTRDSLFWKSESDAPSLFVFGDIGADDAVETRDGPIGERASGIFQCARFSKRY